jgi:hypothetical protein
MAKLPEFKSVSLRKTLGTSTLVAAAAVGAASSTAIPATAAPPAASAAAMKMTPVASNLRMKTSWASAQAEAAKLRASDPVKSSILQAAINSARQRPGFNDKASYSLSFKLSWDVASQTNTTSRQH